jgi:cobalamin biosynthesis Mg chelatase CobN
MKNLYWIILLAVCAACSLLKNSSREVEHEKASAERQITLVAESKFEAQVHAGSVLLIKDSADNSFSMQLWPKGVFTYSAAEGFKGEAEQILISGKTRRGRVTSKHENYSAGTQSDQKVIASESAQHKTENNKKEIQRSVSWKIIVAALLVVALVGWLMIRWLKNK